MNRYTRKPAFQSDPAKGHGDVDDLGPSSVETRSCMERSQRRMTGLSWWDTIKSVRGNSVHTRSVRFFFSDKRPGGPITSHT